jgi:hypothetical protein
MVFQEFSNDKGDTFKNITLNKMVRKLAYQIKKSGTWRLRQEDHKVSGNLGLIARP